MVLTKAKNSSNLMVFFNSFVIWLLALQVLVYGVHQSEVMSHSIQNSLAVMVINFYNLFDEGSASVIGNRVALIDFNTGVTIDNECTGLMLMATVLAASLALITKVKTPLLIKINTFNILIYKAILLFVVILILLAENIVRMAHLLYIVKVDEKSFEFFHLYFWQVINFTTGLMVIYGMLCVCKNQKLIN